MVFSVKPAKPKDKSIIHFLLQPYLDELSHFPDEHPDYKDSQGVYHYPYLDAYWQEEGIRFPYLMYSDDDVAGFAMVRKERNHWEIAEFYVKPTFRRIGVGRICATALLNKYSGTWRIEFNRHNLPSRNLWKNLAEHLAEGTIKEDKADDSHDFIEFLILENRELFEYYNERAPEYEAFYAGEFPTGPRSPELYKGDSKAIQQLVPHYVNGKCIDIACGTGFWLPYYHQNCSAITLIDQSEGVLEECKKKIQSFGIENKAKTVQGDIFKDIPSDRSYNSALAGFIISHFKDEEMNKFFGILRKSLAPGGKFVIIDTVWGEEAKAHHQNQNGMATRRLYDGREFQIYKKYFTKEELQLIAFKNHISLEIIYWGDVFFLASGRFNKAQA
jgi:predicted acetyltransferase/ubiquinone/menaquinone biosynthesis C-methylase UbiE